MHREEAAQSSPKEWLMVGYLLSLCMYSTAQTDSIAGAH